MTFFKLLKKKKQFRNTISVSNGLDGFIIIFSEPIFYFGSSEYMVDESAGYLEVKVWKTGTDLSRPSSVTVRSRQLKPVSAECE